MHVEAGRHLFGGARQAAALVRGLDALGIDNLLVSAAGSELEQLDLPFEHAVVRMAGDGDLGLTRRLVEQIDRWRPDLVHAHSRRGADTFGGRAAARRALPGVITRRVDSDEPAAWVRFKLRPYGAVAALSSAIERDLVERVRIEQHRVVRIASAVDAQRFAPDPAARTRLVNELGLGPSVPIVGIVAQLIERKGHAVLLEAWPRALAQFPDAVLVIVGRGPLAAELEHRVAESGLLSRVRFLGFRDDVPALMAGFDLLVHPALREGLGLAVLEAMSAGVAVVASAAGGIVDSITSGADGVLVPPGRSEPLAGAICALLAAPERRRELGSAARARIVLRHSIGSMARAYLAVYERLIARTVAASVVTRRS